MELPKPLREEALKNIDPNFKDEYVTMLSIAVIFGVDWSKTEGGSCFWFSFYQALDWAEREGVV